MLILVGTKAWSVFGVFLGPPAALGPGAWGRVLTGVIIQEAGGR